MLLEMYSLSNEIGSTLGLFWTYALNLLGNGIFDQNQTELKKKALPRIELGLLDSKSNVLTITP